MTSPKTLSQIIYSRPAYKSGVIPTLLTFLLFFILNTALRQGRPFLSFFFLNSIPENFPRYKSLLSMGYIFTGTTVLLIVDYRVTLQAPDLTSLV